MITWAVTCLKSTLGIYVKKLGNNRMALSQSTCLAINPMVNIAKAWTNFIFPNKWKTNSR